MKFLKKSFSSIMAATMALSMCLNQSTVSIRAYDDVEPVVEVASAEDTYVNETESVVTDEVFEEDLTIQENPTESETAGDVEEEVDEETNENEEEVIEEEVEEDKIKEEKNNASGDFIWSNYWGIDSMNVVHNDWSGDKPLDAEHHVTKDEAVRVYINFHIDRNAVNSSFGGDVIGTKTQGFLPNGPITNEELWMPGDSAPLGHFSVGTDGEIRVQLTEYGIKKNNTSKLTGRIYFSAWAGDFNWDDNNEAHLSTSQGGSFDVKYDAPVVVKGNLNVEKKTTNIDGDNGTASFEIKVTSSEGTFDVVNISDVMNGVKYTGNFKVVDKDGQTVSVNAPAADDTSFNISLPKMNAGDEYTITYDAALNKEYTDGVADTSNKVTATSKKSNDEPISVDKTVNPKFEKTAATIKKTGKYEGDDIQWTITINEKKVDISGYVVSDDMQPKEGTTVTLKDENGASSTISFPYTFPEGSKGTYTITYVTPGSDEDVKNTSNLKSPDNSFNKNGEATVGVPGTPEQPWETYPELGKTGDELVESSDKKTGTVKWTLTIDCSNGKYIDKGAKISDYVETGYFTPAQLEDIKAAFTAAGIKYKDFTKDTWSETSKNFGITLTEKITESKTIVYYSTVDLNGQSMSIKNSASINNKKSISGTIDVVGNPTIKKVDAQNVYGGGNTTHAFSETDNTLSWKIEIDVPAGSPALNSDLVIKETMPNDLTDVSMKLDGNEITPTANGNVYSITINKDDLKAGTYVLEVSGKYGTDTSTWTKQDGKIKKEFNNSVSIESGSGEQYGSTSQKQTVEKDVSTIKKSCIEQPSAKNNNMATFKVEVNPSGADMAEGDTITLVDNLKYTSNTWNLYKLEFVYGSLDIKNTTTGETIQPLGVTFDSSDVEDPWNKDQNKVDHTKTMTIIVPDNTPLTITYKYQVDVLGTGTYTVAANNKITATNAKDTGTSSEGQINASVQKSGGSMEYEPGTLGFVKVDKNNHSIGLPEAEFEIYEMQDGKYVKVDEAISGDNGQFHPDFKFKENTAYMLREVKAPEGYKTAADVEFYVAGKGENHLPEGFNGTALVAESTDNLIQDEELDGFPVTISKQDVAGNEIADAELKVTDSEGTVIDSWTSVEGVSHEITVKAGTYTLTEITAPNGYEEAESITFTVDNTGKVTVNDEEVDAVVMTDEYADQTVTISKQDVVGNEIDGAELTVTDSEGIEVDSWTSEAGKSHEITVQPGTYTLTEITAPDGYVKAEDVTFTVDKDGKVTVNGEEVDKVVMTDEYANHTITISKQDVAGNELKDAKLTLTSADGKFSESWTSDGNAKEFTVQPGTYTLTETTAPDGYEKAESITFTVDETGKVTVNNEEVDEVIMVDEEKQPDTVIVKISKQDVGGNEIEGAELTVTDSEGNEVDSWTSEEGKSHEITVKPGTYTLTEDQAPLGYEKAESITFTVDETGKVTVNGKEVEEVVMTDELSEYDISISKVDVAGAELPGAKLTLTGNTNTGVAIEPVSWTSGQTAMILNLQPGTYTLTEDQAPLGYEKAESITFTVKADGTVTVNDEEVDAVVMTDEYKDQTVTISKQDIAGNEIADAQLTVTDSEDNEVDSWTSEAGKSHEITVKPGTYTLTETTAPDGYVKAESITFTVDKDGNVIINGEEVDEVIMVDEEKQPDTVIVKISKQDVAGDELKGAKLTVVDATNETVATWESDGSVKELQVQPGTYTLTEDQAPLGYEQAESITFTVDKDGKVTVDGKEVDAVVMTDEYSEHKVKLTKVDLKDAYVEGARLVLYEEDGKTAIDTWVTEANDIEIDLLPGTYVLKETFTPKGYVKAADITFTVNVDGTITIGDEDVEDVVMVDEWKDHKVTISKQDVGGNEIGGATITITGTTEDGREITPVSFDTDGVNNHEVELQPGTYTLEETTTPDGYETAESITFTVDKDGKVTVNDEEVEIIVMVDEYSDQKVKFSKVDLNGKRISGATMVLFREGTITGIATWTSSDSEDYELELLPGTYTLYEAKAPKGYVEADKIIFTVDKDGKVSVDGKVVRVVSMTDEWSDQQITISKTDVAGKELEGASLTLSGTTKDGRETEAYTWTSTGETQTFDIQPGTYTLTENRAPLGYDVAEEITFTIDETGKVTIDGVEIEDATITMVDELSDQKVTISKVDVAGDELAGAELSITGTTDAGETIEEIKWTSDGRTKEVELQPGTYTLTETTAPNGYLKAESIEFTVDKEGKVTIGGDEVDAVVMEDKNDDTFHATINISKKKLTGDDELAGATLSLTGTRNDGEAFDGETWTSGEESKSIELFPGTYTLTETSAPLGYTIAESVTFEVKQSGQIVIDGAIVGSVVMKDAAIEDINISKVELLGTDAKELEDASMKLTSSDGSTIEEWTSGKEAYVIKGSQLAVGETYTITEVAAPAGYTVATEITFSIDKDGKITNVSTNAYDVNDTTRTISMLDETTLIKVSKVDIADGKEVENAKIQIIDATGIVVEEWTSTNEAHEITGLTTGVTYTLHEEVAPDGYTIATDTTFTIDETGKVTSTGTVKDGVLLVEDAKTVINVSKVDITTQKEIAGATIQIIDKDGKVVESWTSTEDAHKVEGLLTGVEYTLKETVAPDGYTVTTETTFTIDETGKVTYSGNTSEDGVMLIEDTKTVVNVSKVDITTQKEVAGATIQIIDKDGKVVESWTSTEEAHKVEGLLTGVEYTLHEEVAPNGYTVATDTTFSIDENGKVTYSGTTSNDGVLLIEDTKTLIKVSKVDITNGEEIEGAKIQIIDESGKVVEEWTSTKDAHEIEGLTTGVTYTLRETVAPDGYTITTDTTFTIDKNGKVTSTGSVSEDGTLLIEDTMIKNITIDKGQLVNGKVKLIEGAKLTLTDKTSGKVIDSWTSSKDRGHTIKGSDLIVGHTYVLHEVAAPEGYQIATDIVFTVNEDGSITEVGKSAYAFDKDARIVVMVDAVKTKANNTGVYTNASTLLTTMLGSVLGMILIAKKRKED